MKFKNQFLGSILFITAVSFLPAFRFPISPGATFRQNKKGIQLVVLYTANTNGYLTECECSRDPKGGMARRKTIIDQVRAANPNSILVDAGDVLSTYSKPENNLRIWQIYQLMNYQAINIGENEFIDGWAAFEKNKNQFQIPFVSANTVYKNGESIVNGVKFVTVHGFTIAVVGLNDPERFADLDSTVQSRIEIVSPKNESILKEVFNFAWQRSNFIILLSHLGYEKSKELAQKYDIDVVVIGHGGSEMPQAEKVADALLVHPGSDGQYIGLLQIEWTDSEIQSYQNSLIPLRRTVPQDSVVQKLISDFEKKPS